MARHPKTSTNKPVRSDAIGRSDESEIEVDTETAESDESPEEFENLEAPDELNEIDGVISTENGLERALVPASGLTHGTDPLRLYMDQLRQIPLLDIEEERALTDKFKSTGDLESAKRLVTANLRLVVKIAMEYRRFYSNVMDLIQEGNIGLMKAVSKFDPTRGARLGYYASWWIRSYILKYLLDNFRLVKIGTTQAQKKLFYHLMREKERMEALGQTAAPKLLAEKLDVKEREVIEMDQRLSSRGSEVSIDRRVFDPDSRETWGDRLPDSQPLPDDELARVEWETILADELPTFRASLNERERVILDQRLLSDSPLTLQEVADRYQLTRERVRQIESKVLDKLRKHVSKHFTPSDPA